MAWTGQVWSGGKVFPLDVLYSVAQSTVDELRGSDGLDKWLELRIDGMLQDPKSVSGASTLLLTLSADGGLWEALSRKWMASTVFETVEFEPGIDVVAVGDLQQCTFAVRLGTGDVIHGSEGASWDALADLEDAPSASEGPRLATPTWDACRGLGELEIRGSNLTSELDIAENQDASSPVRYLSAEMPRRVSVDKRFSLVARIESTKRDGVAAEALKPLDVPEGGLPLTITISAPNLRAHDGLERVIVVPRVGSAEPARFVFQGDRPGLRDITVTAWDGGTYLGEARVEVSVEVGGREEPGTPVTVGMGMKRNPGEVTLQIRFDPRQRQYMWQMLSSNCMYDPFVELLGSAPDGQVENTASRLRTLAAGAGGSAAAGWIRQAGINLWDKLVPDEVKQQFWAMRDDISTFTIAADQDIVPWELLYPLAPSSDFGFLVEQFPVVRRVYNQSRTAQLVLDDAVYVVPPGSPQDAMGEVNAIRGKFAVLPGAGAPITRLSDLERVLKAGSFGLLHFACHNSFNSTGSSVTMADGELFEPVRLAAAAIQKPLAARAPLVFFNACRTAGSNLDYTEQMGWASQFMKAGSGAFIGTLWAVRSSTASVFAEAFYDGLTAGHLSLGEASLAARLAARKPDDPTWLAYTVYGDPAASTA